MAEKSHLPSTGELIVGTMSGAVSYGAMSVLSRVMRQPMGSMTKFAISAAAGAVVAAGPPKAKAEPAAKSAAAPAPAVPAASQQPSQSSSMLPSKSEMVSALGFAGAAYAGMTVGAKISGSPISIMTRAAISGVVGALGSSRSSSSTPSTPTPSGSTDIARQAAARTASDMGQRQTVGVSDTSGGSARASSSNDNKGDGRVDGYTRVQNGHTVQVSGYALPASRR